ncbi:MAG: hypothetical protein ACRD9R_04975 [Pyrinomonadaceae bacterium]
MTNRRYQTLTLFASLLALIALPALASAQGSYDPWGRSRDRRDDRYDSRTLRDAARRVENRSQHFERNVDRLLDRSRADGTEREDRINDVARDFRRAAERFEDRVGDGRNSNRGAGEARQLLHTAERIERVLSRVRLDSRAYADWREIRHDLRTIADIYGLRFDGGGRRGDYDPRDRDRRNRRDNNDDWWRRIPFPRS